MLDEFQPKAAAAAAAKAPPTSSATTSTTPAASGPGRPSEAAVEDAPSEDEFAKQIQDGMANLIGELGDNPEMQQQFEHMMQELVAAGAAPTDKEAAEHLRAASDNAPQAPDDAKSGSKKDDSFQDTIRKTMERMQQSGDAATAASASKSGAPEDEILAQMMKELQADGQGGEEDFNSMLMSMMTQLTNKDILYEPMKELHDKYPDWMEKNQDKVKKEDCERYTEQQKLVGEIVERFERDGYKDDNEKDRDYIVERMQKVSEMQLGYVLFRRKLTDRFLLRQMQAAGSPPPDLVGDMSSAQEALEGLDSGCPTQ